MDLTNEQVAAIKSGEAVTVEIDHTACVLIRLDVYEKVKHAVEYDDSPWTDAEVVGLANRTFNSLDAK
jgi:hypothetical protein